MMERKIALQAFMIFTLVFSMFSAVALSNFIPSKGNVANAQPPIQIRYENSPAFVPADGRIYYIPDSGFSGDFVAVAEGIAVDEELRVLETDNLPSGISILPDDLSDQLTLHVDDGGISLPSSEPAGLGITFGIFRIIPAVDAADAAIGVVTEDELISPQAQVVFVVEPAADRPRPHAAFNQTSYYQGDAARLTLVDPHIDCSNNNMNRDPIDIVISGPTGQIAVELQRADAEVNTFRTDIPASQLTLLSDGPGQFSVEYTPSDRGDDECVFPLDQRISETASANGNVMSASIRFERPSYSFVDSTGAGSNRIVLKVTDSDVATDGVPDPDNDPNKVQVTISSGAGELTRILTREAGSDTFSLEEDASTLPIAAAFAPDQPPLAAPLIATYVDASAPGQPSLQASTTVLGERRLFFDQPSYRHDDLMSLSMADPLSNTDPQTFETPQAILCSYPQDGGPLIDSLVINLAESGGPNTGQFVNAYYVGFRIEDLGVEEATTIRVAEDGTTIVKAHLGAGVDCEDPISAEGLSSATPMEPIATIDQPLPQQEDDNTIMPQPPGQGGTDSTTAHEIIESPWNSIERHVCGAYDSGPDQDADGICDNFETTTGVKWRYPADPAAQGSILHTISPTCQTWCPDPTIKDIYVEIDYVNRYLNSPSCSDSNNYKPSTTAQNLVRDAFSTKGIHLHIQLGEDVAINGRCLDTIKTFGDSDQNPDGNRNSYDDLKHDYFGTSTERASSNYPNNLKAKWQFFHYMIFGDLQDPDSGSSGVAEFKGNDAIVTLGGSAFTYNSNNQQAGTLMHELGHNLGLHHGGAIVGSNDYTLNCKPNYASVMSYTRQFATTWFPYDNRYYSDASLLESLNPDGNNLTLEGGEPDETGVLKVSQTSPITSEEIAWGISSGGNIVIVDAPGIANSATWTSINWDDDGTTGEAHSPTQDPISGTSIVNLGITGCQTDDQLQMYNVNDWSNLDFNFREHNADAFATGFGQAQVVGREMTETIRSDFLLQGIAFLNHTVQKLPDKFFNTSGHSGLAEVKQQFSDDLESMMISIQNNRRNETLDQLLEMHKLVDGTVGGSPTDDLIRLPDKDRVDFSSSVLPIPPQLGSATTVFLNSNTVATRLILTDPDENNQSNAEDAIDFIFEDDAAGNEPSFRVILDRHGVADDEIISSMSEYGDSVLKEILPGLDNLSLGETSDSTGVFEEELGFNAGQLDLIDWQGLNVTITYIDSDGDTTEGTVTFTGNDGSVTADKAAVKNGDFITVTVQDQDLNLDDDEIEEFDSTVGTDGIFLVSVETQDEKILGTTNETFTETSIDSGIFTASWTVGVDIPIIMNQGQQDEELATDILITYNDEIDSSGSAGDEIEVNISVVSATGSLQVTPELVGPATELTILVIDSDLDVDSNSIDEYIVPAGQENTDDFFISFSSDRNEVGEGSPDLEETGPNTGVFMFTLELVTDEEACQDDDLSDAEFEAEGGDTDATIGVCPGDLIAIRYEDEEDVKGQSTVVSDVVEVSSWDPEFSADKSSYNVGETITVTIRDPDANIDPDVADILADIRISSDSDQIGDEFNAIETGKDTGVFKLSFMTSGITSTDAILANEGDGVNVEYTDIYPADFEDEGEDKDFTYVVNIAMGGGGGGGGSVVMGGGGLPGGGLPGGGLPGGGLPGGGLPNQESQDLDKVSNVIRVLENTIAAFIADQNIAYEEPHQFIITSLDRDCANDNVEGCTIIGFSENITANADTFQIDSATRDFSFRGEGGPGSIILYVPTELATNLQEVSSSRSFEELKFNVVTSNSSVTTILLEVPNFQPGDLTFSHDTSSKITVLPLKLFDCDPTKVVEICSDSTFKTGHNVFTETIIFNNHLVRMVDCIVIVEVRDSSGVTWSLKQEPCTSGQQSKIVPRGSTIVESDWIPSQSDDYEVRVYVLDRELFSPLLRTVVNSTMTVED